jgi:UDP-N-acetylmuramoyl-L-alanyl-D-glutamate--2,6-diaminopimelate ligase
MYLSHILRSEEILSPEKHANTEIAKPIADSRKIEKNDVFFCEDGFYESGFSYAARAVDAGAALIVTEKGGKSRLSALPIPVLEVENVRKSYARAWSRYENEPQNALRLLAVTGTNGKTSVASFLHGILRNAEIPTGLIGTVEYSDGVDRYPSDYTTPPPDVLYPLFSEMKRKNTRFAVMEASSHAIAQKGWQSSTSRPPSSRGFPVTTSIITKRGKLTEIPKLLSLKMPRTRSSISMTPLRNIWQMPPKVPSAPSGKIKNRIF